MHALKSTFPRAQFGLPLIFKFKDQDVAQRDPNTSTLLPQDAERYASPLIIRPYFSTSTKKWHPLAFLLPNWNEPFNLRLEFADGKDKLPPATGWQLTADVAGQFKPLAGHGPDALSAFCTFFTGRDSMPQMQSAQKAAAPKLPSTPAQTTGAWGKRWVKRSASTGTLEVKNLDIDKTASAIEPAASALLEELPAPLRQTLIKKGGYSLLVTVKNGEIVKLEPVP